ncbi:MAG TPA: fluoride efflux transporter CrcB [Cyclobacteriaceae bacterium]|nr:fluoride efflux transporter CrcB [Cyclobacteriaceae bacterium]
MKQIALIFFGGGLGSVVRFLLGRWVNGLHNINFPFGTLVVNVVACFVLGLIVGFTDHRQVWTQDTRVFWAVGFCGGFSTFSTFSYETMGLMQQGFSVPAILYTIVSVVMCLAAVWGGVYLTK